MKQLLIGALLIAACSTAADAQTVDWSGGYIGAQIGGRWTKNDVDTPTWLLTDTSSTSANGFAVGAFAGYNFQYGSFIFGPEVSAIFNPLSDKAYYGTTMVATERSRAVISFNARAGYAFENLLPYVTGGYSRASYSTSQSFDNGYLSDTFSFKRKREGWNIGGGIDWLATEHILVRAEYRYFDFGQFETNTWDTDLKQQTATLGIAYKF